MLIIKTFFVKTLKYKDVTSKLTAGSFISSVTFSLMYAKSKAPWILPATIFLYGFSRLLRYSFNTYHVDYNQNQACEFLVVHSIFLILLVLGVTGNHEEFLSFSFTLDTFTCQRFCFVRLCSSLQLLLTIQLLRVKTQVEDNRRVASFSLGDLDRLVLFQYDQHLSFFSECIRCNRF